MKLKRALLAVVFAFGLVGASKPPLTDDIITDKVMIKLNADPVAKGGGFKVDVKQGVVTLSGKVESEKQKARAEKLAHKVSGVKGVQNQLLVAPK